MQRRTSLIDRIRTITGNELTGEEIIDEVDQAIRSAYEKMSSEERTAMTNAAASLSNKLRLRGFGIVSVSELLGKITICEDFGKGVKRRKKDG